MKSIRIVLYCSLLTLLLAACGPSNTVRLLVPPPLDGAVLPAPNAPRVTVVMFEDKRMDQTTLGQRRDKSAFVTGDNVPQWISKALADELARNGLQISYSGSVAEARKGNPDYLITGQVDEAWINETSSTDMNTSLRVSYVLANRQARMVRESLNASQSRTGLPSGSAANNLMLDTLRDLVKPMARKIVQTIETKK